jgi:hypothetical protein
MVEQIVISPKESEELKQLRRAYITASKKVIAAIRAGGMSSQSFIDLNREWAAIARRIKEILEHDPNQK